MATGKKNYRTDRYTLEMSSHEAFLVVSAMSEWARKHRDDTEAWRCAEIGKAINLSPAWQQCLDGIIKARQ